MRYRILHQLVHPFCQARHAHGSSIHHLSAEGGPLPHLPAGRRDLLHKLGVHASVHQEALGASAVLAAGLEAAPEGSGNCLQHGRGLEGGTAGFDARSSLATMTSESIGNSFSLHWGWKGAWAGLPLPEGKRVQVALLAGANPSIQHMTWQQSNQGAGCQPGWRHICLRVWLPSIMVNKATLLGCSKSVSSCPQGWQGTSSVKGGRVQGSLPAGDILLRNT